MTSQGPERIMVVDDDPDIASIALIALETVGGFTVETCSSGREAVNRVAAFQPDLILLDAMMPEMSGPETFQALKAHCGDSTPPVVFFTGRVLPDDVTMFKKLGALGVLEKPFDPMSLAGRVRDIWARSSGIKPAEHSVLREQAV